jgi:hypothetical protein
MTLAGPWLQRRRITTGQAWAGYTNAGVPRSPQSD